ncbi:MAG: Oxidoreductase domain protein [Devosia sp.]|nr:Oxidoreductase domain protein [Devosia sp.]
MLRVGILGASRIVPWALGEPAARRSDVQLTAIAARRPGAASPLAERFAINNVYDRYEDVISDPSVDLVYNPLPPHLHAEWSIKALEAGKHVLCEKPFAMNAAEARAMTDAAAANGRRVIEAFHDRYHPVFEHLLDRVKAGDLGTLSTIRAEFSHTIPRLEGEFRRIRSMGGGALMDLGCYPVHWCRSLVQEEPVITQASAVRDPDGYDEEIEATLQFPSGISAHIASRMSQGWHYHARLEIQGDRGTLMVENSLLPQLGHSIRATIDGVFRQYTIGGGTTFDYQLEALVAALRNATPLPTEGAGPLGNMAAIDAIYAAAGF